MSSRSPRATDDDAGVAVARREHAQAAAVDVELVRVRQPGERVPADDDVELEPLQLVGRRHLHRAEAERVQPCPQQVLLVVVRHADGDAVELERHRAGVPLAADRRRARGQPRDEVADQPATVSGSHVSTCGGGQLQMRPPARRRRDRARGRVPASACRGAARSQPQLADAVGDRGVEVVLGRIERARDTDRAAVEPARDRKAVRAASRDGCAAGRRPRSAAGPPPGRATAGRPRRSRTGSIWPPSPTSRCAGARSPTA